MNDFINFKYVPISSSDIEQSYSLYKNTLADNHHSFELNTIYLSTVNTIAYILVILNAYFESF
jgi:hypothetical protein